MAAEQDNAAVVRRFWDLVWNNGSAGHRGAGR